MMTPKSPIVSLIGISLGAIMGVSLYLSGAFNNPDVNKIVAEYTDKGPSIVKEKIIKTPESLGCTTGNVDCQLSAQIPDYIEYSLTKEEAYGYSSTIFIDEKEVEVYSKSRPDWGDHQCFLTEGYYNAETMEGITGCRSDQDKSIECVVNKNFPDLGMFSLKKTDFYSCELPPLSPLGLKWGLLIGFRLKANPAVPAVLFGCFSLGYCSRYFKPFL